MKKLVFNSDDFGYSGAFNEGIKRGFLSGVLSSTCILANGEAFDEAIEDILPQIPEIGLGIHLNIIEGKSLTNPSLLCDNKGFFNKGFIHMLLNSANHDFLNQVEKEFRAQIEKILAKTNVDHINSHVHTHAIPGIFKLTCKLAEEYGIKNIRTQFEIPYFIPKLKKHLTVKYPVNLIKLILLNSFSTINRKEAEKYNLKTNDYILGVTYTGYMDEDAVNYGLEAINSKNCIAEILIHPAYFEDDQVLKPFNYNEYLITQSSTIKEKIMNQGWILTNYKEY